MAQKSKSSLQDQSQHDRLHKNERDHTPVKATDRMSPQFSGYAEGRKPNVGGSSGKISPHANRERSHERE